ncbi:MAG: glycosyltransferase family 2 protein [Coriobacteriales bacterium]|jgi:glycosyltransferase involved in cell wall biosynthesis
MRGVDARRGTAGGADPLVTVVVPVHNAAPYLRQRMDCLLGQTLRDIQVVCVDDGSTDESLDILRDYALQDGRVLVVPQENLGPAVARNRGIELARGAWLTCMDADDYCDRDLLGHVLGAVDAAQASAGASSPRVDVAVFPERSHNVVTGTDVRLDYAFQAEHFPAGVFTWRDCPDRILTSFQNWLHNKLFRAEFVRENRLRLQDLHHTEDMLFTCSALLLARGILCVDGSYAYYRIGQGSSQLYATDAWPLDFYEACRALRGFIVERGMMGEVRRSYLNWVGGCVLSNVDIMRDPAGMRAIYDALHGGGLAELGLADAEPEEFFNRDDCERLRVLTTEDYDAFLVAEHAWAFERWHREHEDMLAVVNSRSFRLGRAITGVPRRLRDLLRRR